MSLIFNHISLILEDLFMRNRIKTNRKLKLGTKKEIVWNAWASLDIKITFKNN